MTLFKNKVFLTIIATDIIQQMAIWIRNLAIMFFVMDVTNGDPLAISTLNVIEYVPMFLLTFIGGMIADRYNPKRIMLLGDSLSFISFVILGFFISKDHVYLIFIAVLVSAIITQFSMPASQKYFKEYVEEKDVETAIGIAQMLGSLFFVIGPFLGSFFYFNFGIDKTLIIISALFVISILLILTLPNKKFPVIENRGYFNDIKLTFRYLKKKPQLYTLIKVFFIVSFSIGIANNLDIFLVTRRLGLSEEFYQFFSGVAGIGVVVGGALYLWLSKYFKTMKIVYVMLCIFAVTVFIEGYSTIPTLTIILQFIDNVIGGLLSGFIMAYITKATDQEYLGKVNGLTSTLMYMGMMGGIVSSGFIMKEYSIVAAFGVASIAFIIASIVSFVGFRAQKRDVSNM
ncbi:MAG: MFS transporter [Clostridium sp.]|uniref:MFS transporter n=1 Tax=Clostridium sp. TaxID=1506 RepID=UPI002FCBA4A0